jgi:hypothetical protein
MSALNVNEDHEIKSHSTSDVPANPSKNHDDENSLLDLENKINDLYRE